MVDSVVGPAMVFERVVVVTFRAAVVGGCFSTVCPAEEVVVVTVLGGGDTPGKRTVGLQRGHVPSDLLGGSPGQRVYVDGVAVMVDQSDLMVGPGLGFGDMPCSLGRDRPDSADKTRL